MNARPRSITIIGWIFILSGSIALFSGLLPFFRGITSAQLGEELKSHWMVHLSRIIAIVGGLFLLRGRNWARWLLVAWILFHLVISAMHSLTQLLTHAAIFTIILYFLFKPQKST